MILRVNATALHVLEPEKRGTEKNPSLLFIHGAGGNGEIWNAQASAFHGKHAVFRLDLPGHGGSDGRGEDRISAYAEWVRLVSENLFGSEPFVLVGHSMGGAITLELSLTPPNGLRGIVLVGSGAKLAVTRAIFQMLREDPEAFFESLDRFAFSSDAPRAVRDRLIRLTRQCSTRLIFDDFKACDRFDLRNRLHEITLPALVLCGEEDQLTPLKYSGYLHENLHGSSLVTIPQAGHMVMAERPDLVNEAIGAFLGALRL